LTLYIQTHVFISKQTIMASLLLASITDTLTRKPEYGIVSSVLSISMSTTQLLQTAGVILGLFIAVITAVLKIIELKDKLRERRKSKRLKKLLDDAKDVD